jgi:hypothetical protein
MFYKNQQLWLTFKKENPMNALKQFIFQTYIIDIFIPLPNVWCPYRTFDDYSSQMFDIPLKRSSCPFLSLAFDISLERLKYTPNIFSHLKNTLTFHSSQPTLSLPTPINSTPRPSTFILHPSTSANPRPCESEREKHGIWSGYTLHKVTFIPQVCFSQWL